MNNSENIHNSSSTSDKPPQPPQPYTSSSSSPTMTASTMILRREQSSSSNATTPPSSPTCKNHHKQNALRAESIRALSKRLRDPTTALTSSVRSLDELALHEAKVLAEFQMGDTDSDSQSSSSSSSSSDNRSNDDNEAAAAVPAGADNEAEEQAEAGGNEMKKPILAPVATNEQVRSKLLLRLGIQNASAAPASVSARNAPPVTEKNTTVETFEIPLNDVHEFDKPIPLMKRGFSFFSNKSTSSVGAATDAASATEEKDAASSSSSSEHGSATGEDGATAAAAAAPMKKSVRFNPTVQGRNIPSHKVYSHRIRQTIWSGAEELQENVARNVLEFSAENWNWEEVVDDDGMIWYHGQPIHPVHFTSQQ